MARDRNSTGADLETTAEEIDRTFERRNEWPRTSDTRRVLTDGGEDAAKVIGKEDGDSGVGVYGEATGEGETYGVWGQAVSGDGYGLGTSDHVEVGGVFDTQTALEVNIDGNSNLHHGADTGDGEAGNVVLGHSSNGVQNNAVGAVIGGGGFDDDSTAEPNTVLANFGTVSGGKNNQAGSDNGDATDDEYATVGGGNENTASDYNTTVGGGRGNTASGSESTVGGGSGNTASGSESTVGGGSRNTASGSESTVGGGFDNIASDSYTTVAGGSENTASSPSSTVGGGWLNTSNGGNSTIGGGFNNTASGGGSTVPGGVHGAAESNDTFLWNDGSEYHTIPGDIYDEGLSSDTAVDGEPVTGANTFSVSAQGGVRFITGSNSVTYIKGGSTSWSNTSSRTAKTNIDPVDTQQVLAGVEELEVATWEYRDDDGEGTGTTHIGPMAEEFHEILDADIGSSDEHINSLNADGVLFAALQGLSERLEKKDERIDALEAENDRKDDRIEALQTENDQLRERLSAVESRLDALADRSTEVAPADD